MANQILKDLQTRFKHLQSDSSPGGQDSFKKLLEDCTHAGKSIEDSIDRDNLKWLAQEIGDTILKETNEYPPIEILPYEDERKKFNRPIKSDNLPQRNPFFTGRNRFLQDLFKSFSKSPRQAISGLGGIGKTQIAIEYVYQYSDHYDAIFWVNAHSDARLDFTAIARTHDLPGKNAENLDDVIQTVKQWLEETHERWLLIFDNADNPERLLPLLPNTSQGHILLTSRASSFKAIGIAEPIQIVTMGLDEAVEFLVKRTGGEERDSVKKVAAELAQELGCLPLALEQAAAFVSAQQVSFQDYLRDYRARRLALFQESSPVMGSHPESLLVTWNTCFQEVERASKPAAELLRFSAFLNPDNIPFELILQGAAELDSVLANALVGVNANENQSILKNVLDPLTSYSLIYCDYNSRTYSIHCLVQEVLIDNMSLATRQKWAKRAIYAMNQVFPSADLSPKERFDRHILKLCERLLPHAKTVAKLIEQYELESEVAACLLNRVGYYLQVYAQLADAALFLEQALELRKRLLEKEHPDVASSLNNLAELYFSQARYEEAESLYKEALELRKHLLSLEDRDVAKNLNVAKSLNNLAELYYSQARYNESKTLCEEALAIRQKFLAPNDPYIAQSLHNLARLYAIEGRYEQAEGNYQQALTINKEQLGSEHPYLARTYNDLARLYSTQGRYEDAESMYRQALDINRSLLGSTHPLVAINLNHLAEIYRILGRYTEAEAVYLQALDLKKRLLGAEHPRVADNLDNLALFYQTQGRYKEAEPLYRQALDIRQRFLGENHPDVAATLNNLAYLYQLQGRYEESEPLYRRALDLYQQSLGEESPNVANCLNNLAELYRIQGQYQEAEPLYQKALELRRRILGENHPEIASSLNNLALLYYLQGRYEESEPRYRQALELYQQLLGKENLTVANCLNNLAELYRVQGQYQEAEPLYRQALEIYQRSEEEHPLIIDILNNLALLYQEQGSYEEAEPLYLKAMELRKRLLVPEALDVAISLDNLALLYQEQERYDEAEPLYRQALELRERLLGAEALDVAISLDNLALLYQEQGRYAEAESLLVQVLKIVEQVLGLEHPYTANIREHLDEVRENLP